MKLNCIIDDTEYNLNVSPDKPLSKILNEHVESFSINNKCLGASCGNCMVIVDDIYTLACLVPAFKLRDNNQIRKIETFESFKKSDLARDIERAYSEVGSRPCYQCYASKTLLISSLVLRTEKAGEVANMLSSNAKFYKKDNLLSTNMVSDEMKLSGCTCMEISHIEKIVNLVCEYRSKRNGIHK